MENEDRRKADELFRIKIIEHQGEIKALLVQTNSDVRALHEKVNDHGIKITNMETALWGYPKSEDAGLLEKNRNQNRKWAIGLFVINVVAWSVIGLIKPLYQKVVSDWAYNSVSERWVRQQQRPKIKHVTVRIAPDQPGAP